MPSLQVIESVQQSVSIDASIERVELLLLGEQTKLYLEHFYTDREILRPVPTQDEKLQFTGVSTLTIEGWLFDNSRRNDAFVSVASIYGHDDCAIVHAVSPLAPRSDLPLNGRYFSLSISLANLLLKNLLRIQVHFGDCTLDAALVNIDCKPTGTRMPVRYISILTCGRTGSTYLSKALDSVPFIISPSRESIEHSMLRNMLLSLLNGMSFCPISRRNFTGSPEHYLEPPFNPKENPVDSMLALNNIEKLFEMSWETAFSHYTKKLGIVPVGVTTVLVEKNWGSPLLPLISRQLGVLNVILIRHPYYVANSIVEYVKKTGYRMDIDPIASLDDLCSYIEKSCKCLDWLAEHTPNAILIRYEDLIDNPHEVVGRIVSEIDSHDSKAQLEKEIDQFSWESAKVTTSDHKSDGGSLSQSIRDRIEIACADFLGKYYRVN